MAINSCDMCVCDTHINCTLLDVCPYLVRTHSPCNKQQIHRTADCLSVWTDIVRARVHSHVKLSTLQVWVTIRATFGYPLSCSCTPHFCIVYALTVLRDFISDIWSIYSFIFAGSKLHSRTWRYCIQHLCLHSTCGVILINLLDVVSIVSALGAYFVELFTFDRLFPPVSLAMFSLLTSSHPHSVTLFI